MTSSRGRRSEFAGGTWLRRGARIEGVFLFCEIRGIVRGIVRGREEDKCERFRRTRDILIHLVHGSRILGPRITGMDRLVRRLSAGDDNTISAHRFSPNAQLSPPRSQLVRRLYQLQKTVRLLLQTGQISASSAMSRMRPRFVMCVHDPRRGMPTPPPLLPRIVASNCRMRMACCGVLVS
jgi:hypothetical protein